MLNSNWANNSMSVVSWMAALFVLGALGLLLSNLAWEGFQGLSFSFLVEEPSAMGRRGGIGPILVSTFYIIGIALVASIPLGLLTSLYLSEFANPHSWITYFVRRSLEVLAGVPSIVFGLFGNAFFSYYLELGFSIWSGGLTLACMVLPIFIKITEESLRSIPSKHRMSVEALGFSKTRSIWSFLVPMALPGILVATILGFGRAIAETAALLFTSGYVDRWPESFWDSGRALSVHIYDLAMNVPGGDGKAYSSGLVLILVILGVTTFTKFAAHMWLERKGFYL